MAGLQRRAAVLMIAGLASCGYRFSAPGSGFPEGLRSVRAPILANRTSEPGLEALFTQALRRELLRNGLLVDGGAGAVIEGEVQSLSSGPTLLGPGGKLASYRIQASALVKLKKGEVVLRTVQASGAEDYLPGRAGDILDAEANRQAALHRLAETLMRDVVEQLGRT